MGTTFRLCAMTQNLPTRRSRAGFFSPTIRTVASELLACAQCQRGHLNAGRQPDDSPSA